ncbi:MAG TPA: riboflavin synthase [Longimicrobiales bacterium]|jgi:riboflavin synthase
MFTGIVETTGTVSAVREGEGARVLTIRAPEVMDDLAPGHSVAVDGACLTAVEVTEDAFTVEVIGTTLSRTVAGGYEVGTRVNLERAMRLGARLDGHMVQGHVDGLGHFQGSREAGEYRLLDFRVPPIVEEVTILHGSIAINGISLTVNAMPGPGLCQVAIIPYTWEVTNLRGLTPGDPVNLEGDLIGKYVGKILAARFGPSSPE